MAGRGACILFPLSPTGLQDRGMLGESPNSPARPAGRVPGLHRASRWLGWRRRAPRTPPPEVPRPGGPPPVQRSPQPHKRPTALLLPQTVAGCRRWPAPPLPAAAAAQRHRARLPTHPGRAASRAACALHRPCQLPRPEEQDQCSRRGPATQQGHRAPPPVLRPPFNGVSLSGVSSSRARPAGTTLMRQGDLTTSAAADPSAMPYTGLVSGLQRKHLEPPVPAPTCRGARRDFTRWVYPTGRARVRFECGA